MVSLSYLLGCNAFTIFYLHISLSLFLLFWCSCKRKAIAGISCSWLCPRPWFLACQCSWCQHWIMVCIHQSNLCWWSLAGQTSTIYKPESIICWQVIGTFILLVFLIFAFLCLISLLSLFKCGSFGWAVCALSWQQPNGKKQSWWSCKQSWSPYGVCFAINTLHNLFNRLGKNMQNMRKHWCEKCKLSIKICIKLKK